MEEWLTSAPVALCNVLAPVQVCLLCALDTAMNTGLQCARMAHENRFQSLPNTAG
jgi:hypothetical protein